MRPQLPGAPSHPVPATSPKSPCPSYSVPPSSLHTNHSILSFLPLLLVFQTPGKLGQWTLVPSTLTYPGPSSPPTRSLSSPPIEHSNLDKSENLHPSSLPFPHYPHQKQPCNPLPLSPSLPGTLLWYSPVYCPTKLEFTSPRCPAQHFFYPLLDESNRPSPAALNRIRPRGFRLT